VAAVQSFVDDGLFLDPATGSNTSIVAKLMRLAEEADEAKWHRPSAHEPEQFIHPLIHTPIHIIDVGGLKLEQLGPFLLLLNQAQPFTASASSNAVELRGNPRQGGSEEIT
jgi:hypothetical protein